MLTLRRGDVEESERRFHRALEIAPAWYERALAIDPTSPHVRRRLADLFYDRGDYGRALDQNEDLRAVRTLPGWPALVERAETAAATVAVAKPGGS
jgi:hypothetical protein